MWNKTFLLAVSIFNTDKGFPSAVSIYHLGMGLQIKSLDGTDHNYPCLVCD